MSNGSTFMPNNNNNIIIIIIPPITISSYVLQQRFVSVRSSWFGWNCACTLNDTWQLFNVFIVVCSWDLIKAWFMEKFLRFKRPKMKEAICFLLTLPLMREWSHSCCVVRNCQYLLSLNYFRNFVWILQERVSSLFFFGFIKVVQEIIASVACEFGDMWA